MEVETQNMFEKTRSDTGLMIGVGCLLLFTIILFVLTLVHVNDDEMHANQHTTVSRCHGFVCNNCNSSNSVGIRSVDCKLEAGYMVYKSSHQACSQIQFEFGNTLFTGSGFFFADSDNFEQDLKHGWFVTAAHCVMETLENGTRVLASSIYVQNPVSDNWVEIQNSDIYYNGVADVAVIHTQIDLSVSSSGEHDPAHYKALRFSNTEPRHGDICYVVANPSGIDDDSVSLGVVRDPKYCEVDGVHKYEAIFVSCPSLGGVSGGPILNTSAEVISLYTFGLAEHECFGGGVNLRALKFIVKSLKHDALSVLHHSVSSSLPNSSHDLNRNKRVYVGLDWRIPSASTLHHLHQQSHIMESYSHQSVPVVKSFPSEGVVITYVSVASPLYGHISPGDVLLSVEIAPGSTVDDRKVQSAPQVISMGNKHEQRTPGVLLELDVGTVVKFKTISHSTFATQTISAQLNTTYSSVPEALDVPLSREENLW